MGIRVGTHSLLLYELDEACGKETCWQLWLMHLSSNDVGAPEGKWEVNAQGRRLALSCCNADVGQLGVRKYLNPVVERVCSVLCRYDTVRLSSWSRIRLSFIGFASFFSTVDELWGLHHEIEVKCCNLGLDSSLFYFWKQVSVLTSIRRWPSHWCEVGTRVTLLSRSLVAVQVFSTLKD